MFGRHCKECGKKIGSKSMKQKLKQKLSDRLLTFFLTRVKKYDTRYFSEELTWHHDDRWECVPPIQFATKMVKECMEMIVEYKPEDIE